MSRALIMMKCRHGCILGAFYVDPFPGSETGVLLTSCKNIPGHLVAPPEDARESS